MTEETKEESLSAEADVDARNTTTQNRDMMMDNYSIRFQLDRAAAAVYQNKEASEKLFGQWRFSLLQISYLVVLITLHQAQAPITECIKNIKAVNQAREQTDPSDLLLQQQSNGVIDLWKAIPLIGTDSLCEVTSLVMALCLTAFLCEKPFKNFRSSLYRIAACLIPIVVSLYYYQKPNGCLQDSPWHAEWMDLMILPPPTKRTPTFRMRSFPVVLIFHAMVTASIGFMVRQQGRYQQNIAKVEKLRNDMEQIKSNSKTKKHR